MLIILCNIISKLNTMEFMNFIVVNRKTYYGQSYYKGKMNDIANIVTKSNMNGQNENNLKLYGPKV